LRFDRAGVLAMNNRAANMNGSQFFVTYTALPELDGQYTIFGRVIEGMEVLNSLRPRNPESDEILLPADQLISVSIEEQ
jgi:cyclophilin family peptidyl-prolyl cis-trans isomerase